MERHRFELETTCPHEKVKQIYSAVKSLGDVIICDYSWSCEDEILHITVNTYRTSDNLVDAVNKAYLASFPPNRKPQNLSLQAKEIKLLS